MKKTLFGSLGDMIKGNIVMIVLALCVVAAGAVSWYTVKDINEKLENQNVTDPVSESGEEQQSEDVQDVQTEAENVPLKDETEVQEETQTAPQTTDKAHSPPQTETTAKFILPVQGEIFAAYSGNELVYNTTMQDWRSHNGIDVYASQGEAVRAGSDGIITDVYSDGMLGWVVQVQCGEYGVRYCGLDGDVQVKKGDRVTQGQKIGTVGEIPLESVEKSHIHLEFFTDSGYADPNDFIG